MLGVVTIRDVFVKLVGSLDDEDDKRKRHMWLVDRVSTPRDLGDSRCSSPVSRGIEEPLLQHVSDTAVTAP